MEEDPPPAPHPLLGKWQTNGVDPQLGEVTVCFRFVEDGVLEVAVRAADGVELRFPGTWSAVEEMLTLNGAYFQPDGVSQVSYRIEAEGVLVFEGDGGQQEWRRQEE